MKTVMTFGDSNTHGTPPATTDPAPYDRFDTATRWPRVMAAELGSDWKLVEAGLPSRSTAFDCPEHGVMMNGLVGLHIALRSHGPIDWLTLMLGSNDVQPKYGLTPQDITRGMKALLTLAQSDEYQARHGGFQTLLIAPPPWVEVGTWGTTATGAREKSEALAPLYESLAKEHGVPFLDAGQIIRCSPIDGVHFEAADHPILGRAIAEAIKAT